MRCIFCKIESSCSKSKEHVIPESLGNKSHILPKGVVCDKCNNYFANKIEKKVLELPYFKSLRGRNVIENKKGKIPGIPGFIASPNIGEIEIHICDNKIVEVIIEEKGLYERIQKGEFNKFYIPLLEQPPSENIHISKFLGKIALEALAQRVSKVDNWQTDFIENESLDPLRNFVRFGKGYKYWPYLSRKIYNEDRIINNSINDKLPPYQTMHEYDFLIPNNPIVIGEIHIIEDIYFVCAIMGIEYTINLTEKGLGEYLKWLNNNNNKSILLMEKKDFHNFKI